MDNKTPEHRIQLTLAGAAKGDASAWQQIVKNYAPRVFALILSRAHDPELAEEITQATFVKVVKYLPAYKEQGRFDSWLFQIASNLLRDEMRRRKRQAKTIDTTDNRGDTPDSSSATWQKVQESAASEQHSPLEKMEQAEQIEQLRMAISQLGDADRQIIELRHAAGLSFSQIAESLEQPLGTVLARGHRALKKLKQMLTEIQVDKVAEK